MATYQQYEEKIVNKWYGNASLARAAVARAKNLGPKRKAELLAMISEKWKEVVELNTPKPKPVNGTKAPEFDILSFQVALYAARHRLPISTVVVDLTNRIVELGLDAVPEEG